MALHLKGVSSFDQSASLIAYGVGVAHVDVAAQASAQQGVQAAVYGYDVVALLCQAAQQLGARPPPAGRHWRCGARHHRRAANH